ncbi:MAG: hypothetical protein RL689_1544 [Planctomycetota bacterium]
MTPLERALSLCRTLDPEIQCNSVMALLYIARRPGSSPTELSSHLDLTSGAGSRLVSRLSEWDRFRVRGLQLVAAEPDPVDRRVRRLCLTPKGTRFVNELAACIGQSS